MAKKYTRKLELITGPEQLAAAIESAGASFIGLYMAEFVESFDCFSTKDKKNQYMDYFYNCCFAGHGTKKELREKLDITIRIIESGLTAEALEYVANFDSPNIGILLDTYHMNIEEDNIGDAIRLVGAERLKSFHTGDNNRRAPGRGHIDWDEVFSALASIGYKGHIVSEPFVMKGGEVGRDIHVYRDLIEHPCEASIDAEARYLLQFEKGMLNKYGMN